MCAAQPTPWRRADLERLAVIRPQEEVSPLAADRYDAPIADGQAEEGAARTNGWSRDPKRIFGRLTHGGGQGVTISS
jgi:hypothetical protein